jgi:hypothetical protein
VRSGGRFNFGFWFTEEHALGMEANFFLLQNMVTDFSAASTGIPILARPFVNFTPGAADFGMNSSLKVAYPGLVAGSFFATTKSNLLGTDVYFRQALCCDCCRRLDLLAGYRYLRLSEGLQISETETGTNPTSPLFGIPIVLSDGFNTRNNFNGGEIGLIGECMRNDWFVRLIAKVALGATDHNVNINGSTTIFNMPLGPGGFLAVPSNSGSHHSSAFSVVPEVGIDFGYAITPHMRVFTGYSFLYWTRVARPGDQIDLAVNTTQPPLGNALVGPARPAFALQSSGFWAQGINFGVEFRY